MDIRGIIPSMGTNHHGTWVIDREHILPLIRTGSLTKNSVFVLDFDAPAFHVDEGKHAMKLSGYLVDLAKMLYEDEKLLSIYINVHPDSGVMSRAGRKRKAALEDKVFLKYSDYELCVRNEGLDSVTAMCQKKNLYTRNLVKK